jgi:hypothetical protein
MDLDQQGRLALGVLGGAAQHERLFLVPFDPGSDLVEPILGGLAAAGRVTPGQV